MIDAGGLVGGCGRTTHHTSHIYHSTPPSHRNATQHRHYWTQPRSPIINEPVHSSANHHQTRFLQPPIYML